MGVDVPQWLSQTYVRSVQAAGSALPPEELTDACKNLIERWSTPERRYHDVQHLIDTLTRIETLLSSTHSPHLVQLAAFYHGAVFSIEMKDIYTRNGGEDEHASAHLAEEKLTALGVGSEQSRRVADLIRSLRVHSDEASSQATAKFHAIDVDSLVLHDAHLGCLSAQPQHYRAYVSQIRDEYAQVSDIGFCSARYAIVSRFLRRQPLFITPLARGWEENARENLKSERDKLEAQLKELNVFSTIDSWVSSESVPARVPVPDYIDGMKKSDTRGENANSEASAHVPPPPLPSRTAGEGTAHISALTSESVKTASTGEVVRTTGELPSSGQAQHRTQTQIRDKVRFSMSTSQLRAVKQQTSSLENIPDSVTTSDTSPTLTPTVSEETKKRQRDKITEQIQQRLREREKEENSQKSYIHTNDAMNRETQQQGNDFSQEQSDDSSVDKGSGQAISHLDIDARQDIQSEETAPSAPSDFIGGADAALENGASAPSATTPQDASSYGMEREPID